MHRPITRITVLLLSLIFIGNAQAQSRLYHLYVDSDNNTGSGCNVALPDFATTLQGVDKRLSIETTGQPPSIASTRVHSCNGATFDAGVAASPAALGLNTGVNGADVFEAEAGQFELGITATGLARFYFHSESDTAGDVVLTNTQGGPIILGFVVTVPAMGLLAAALLALGFVWLARRRLNGRLSALIVLVGVAGVVWAMTIVVDGQTGDWNAISPIGLDPVGDTSQPGEFADFNAVFLFIENNTVYVRMDVVDVENQTPIANPGSDVTLEDTAIILTLSGSDGDGDPLTFNITQAPANGALGPVNVVNATTSTVQYTPNADFNGVDAFMFTANDGQADSAPVNFDLSITAVNDAPNFISGGDVVQLKDTGPFNQPWATGLSAGPPDEAGQSLSFNITANDNPGLFSVAPVIDASGQLSFTGVADQSGVANLTVVLMDNGGTANGGVNTSAPVNFSITLQSVNDEPSFTPGSNQVVLEDAGAQTVPAWATAISAGPPDEAGQVLTFNITGNTNPALFAVAPAVDPLSGDLTFTPAADANGAADITVELMDDGGTANGGDDTSPPVTFNIAITAVNDAPLFTPGGDINVLEDSGPFAQAWATGIAPGPADEAGQNVNFTVNNSNNALFSVQPAIDPAGNLTFTPAAEAFGSATVDVTLMDDGGTANGGVDTSATVMFAINIGGVNDAPTFTPGAAAVNVDEDSPAQSLAWASAISPGPANEAGQTVNFILTQSSIESTLSFTAAPSISNTTGNLEFTAAANAYGTVDFTVTLMDDGGTANGGVDTSAPFNLSLTINPLNDPPSSGALPAIEVTTHVRIDVPAGSGLLSLVGDEATEAADPNGPAAPGTNVSIGMPVPTVSTNGGDLSINAATGAFSYNPPAGFTGADSFDVVFCDDGIGAPGPACSAPQTININVSGNTVWFIDNTAAPGGDGRLTTPFNSVVSFNTGATDAAGDYIFLYTGSGSYTGVNLLDDQILFAQGTSGVTFAAFTGLTPAPNSVALPTLGGARPTINAGGAGVTVAMNNSLRGFNIGNTSGSGLFAPAAGGTLVIRDLEINGTGRAINLNGATTLDAVFDNIRSTGGGVNGIIAGNSGGSLQVLGETNITTTTGGDAVIIIAAPAATDFDFGTLTIAGSAQGGVTLNAANANAVFRFTDPTITTTAGTGFSADAGQIAVTGNNGAISATGSAALSLNNVTLLSPLSLMSVTSTNSSGLGVQLNGVTGNVTINGGTISNSTSTAYRLVNSNGTFVHNGNISVNASSPLVVDSNQGSATFNGSITSSGQGIQMLNNNAAFSLSFSNTLALNTGPNIAFTASGGGTVQATAVNSTVTTTTGTAVSVSGVAIGAGDLVFRSINANGATEGIVLANTGPAGGMVILGDGTGARNGSGGTIQNTIDDAIRINNSVLFEANSLNIFNAGNTVTSGDQNNLAVNDHAIEINGGGDITLSGVHINNPAASGIEAVNLTGINRMDSDSRIENINASNMQAIEVRNTDTNMTSFTLDDVEIANQANTNGSSYVLFLSFGSSNMTVNVLNGSLFDNIFGQALQASVGEGAAGANGVFNLTVTDSVFRNASPGTVGVGASGGIAGIVASARESATMNYTIDNNTLFDLGRPLVNGGTVTIQGIGGNTKILDGTLHGNDVDRIGYPNSVVGTTTVGHRFKDVVTENNITRLDHESDNNDIDDTSREAWFISSRGNSSDFDVALDNNRLGVVTAIGMTNREAFELLSEDSSNMQIEVTNNTIRGNTSALDQVVDIDTENTSVMHIHFNDNSVSNLGVGDHIVVSTENGTSTHCMQFTGNTAGNATFNENSASHSIEDLPNIVGNNPGIPTIVVAAGVTNTAINSCNSPDF